MEVTPDILINKLNERFNLAEEVKQPITESNWLDRVNDTFIALFTSPNTVASAFAVLIVVFIGINLLNQPEMFDEKGGLRLITQINKPNYIPVSNDAMKGIDVALEGNEITINQRLGVERLVLITNNQDIILSEQIINKRKRVILLNKIEEMDSIRVVMESEGVIVFDDWILLK